MKLVDILASELKNWPSTRTGAVGQSESGSLHLNQDARHGSDFFGWTTFKFKMAEDWKTAWVTRVEWQAAVDALNAPKVVEWDGVGSPQPGCSIEYSIGDGWYPCEVRYVLNRDDCPGIALIAWCEHLGKDQYLSNDRDHRFRPARTAEQVAAEERINAITEMRLAVINAANRKTATTDECLATVALYDAGYRRSKQ